MAYERNQPQLQSSQQPGIERRIGQQPPQSQQPQFQHQPTTAGQGSQPTAQQAWPSTQQLGSIPQGLGQQLPQIQQPAPAQQFGQLQPQDQFGQLQPQQVGQFGTPPVVSSQSVPQGQAAQVPHVQGQQIPQQLGQQIPQRAQWGAQASGQLAGRSAPSMGQTSTERSVQSTAQSLPSQMQEFGTGSAQQVSEQTQQRLTGTPSIDIVDTPDELVLFVDLPGYEEENIKIQADGQNLSVSAERRDEDQEEGREYTRERPQKLHRTVRLPTRANVNEADASYENGVCKITLPKMEEDRQHEIAFQ